MKNKKDIILKITLILIIVFFSISVVHKNFQNDTFTLISLGNKVLDKGIFDKEEILLWHDGLEYNIPEWLTFVIIAIIYNHFGFLGIYIFEMFIAAITSLTIFYIFLKRKHNIVLSFITTLFTIYFLAPYIAGRAQILSNLILIFEYYFINRLLDTNKKRYSIAIIALSILMLNVHTNLFTMYLVVFLPYIAEIILSKLFNKNEDSKIIIEKKKGPKLFFVTLIITLICGILNPLNTGDTYIAIFKITNSIFGKNIIELQPMKIINYPEFYTMLIWIFGILTFSKTKIRVSDALFILGYGVLSCVVVRNMMYFIIFRNDWFNKINR